MSARKLLSFIVWLVSWYIGLTFLICCVVFFFTAFSSVFQAAGLADTWGEQLLPVSFLFSVILSLWIFVFIRRRLKQMTKTVNTPNADQERMRQRLNELRGTVSSKTGISPGKKKKPAAADGGGPVVQRSRER